MKKIIALVLTALLALSLVACGSETKTDDADKTEDKTSTELTGTVSTDGSTSMEKVIGQNLSSPCGLCCSASAVSAS